MRLFQLFYQYHSAPVAQFRSRAYNNLRTYWRVTAMRRLTGLLLLVLLAANARAELEFASGSWFDPARSGEGFVVQTLPGGKAVVTWFTYPPMGAPGQQAWMLGVGDVANGKITINHMEQPTGATFGPGFDPADVVRLDWGSLTLTFHNCGSATAAWSGPPAYGSGQMSLVRLSSIDDVGCNPTSPDVEDRVISGRSGAFFDPAHDGEGWMIEVLDDGRVVVYWFTYDDMGNQAWMIGVAKLDGRTLWIDELLQPHGARFGNAFDPDDIEFDEWGSLGMVYDSCDDGGLRYDSLKPEFGAGTLLPVRLAMLGSTSCAEPGPVPPLNGGSWSYDPSKPMPDPVGESVSVGVGDQVYLFGGWGGLDRLRRFDPASGTFTDLPAPPEGRHHPMLATDGQSLYQLGGYFGKQEALKNFWRFDLASETWEILPDLPEGRAAGAAVYAHGRVYLVSGNGIGSQLHAWDLRREQWMSFDGGPFFGGDHSNAVVFENEIWQMGGRSGAESNRVKIWNPVTETWREGPTMSDVRSGFAARVVQGQIMVAGGELIDSAVAIVPSLEIFAPGADDWVKGPNLAVAVHGVSGASAGGTLVLLGGSAQPGSVNSNGAVQIYHPAPQQP